jgi:AAA+ ATPase superfamily predicted ATPase
VAIKHLDGIEIAAYDVSLSGNILGELMKEIVGREKEITLLESIVTSKQAELIAIYGRRRVGKTFLIHQFLSNKGIFLECTGIKDGSMHDQLANFISAFQATFYPTLSLKPPKSWREAFDLLTKKIDEIPKTKKIIIFFDEVPWLATRRSKFLQEFDYFWNTKWSRLPNLKLILCGSAASWILDNLINAKGGLHNRITRSILLEPFTLGETKKFLLKQSINLTYQQILDVYMVMGGVPFYLSQLDKNKSISQNINDLCFTKEGILYSEFTRLFKSLFESYELNLRIIKVISKYRYGISLTRLVKEVNKTVGGRFIEKLQELEAAGFIQKVLPYGKKHRDHYYRINDEYTMFYLNWIEKVGDKVPKGINYWIKISKSASWQSWAGFAFELVCHKHVSNIIHALNLDQVGCLVGSWKSIPAPKEKKQGTQIDLLFDREDDAITLCEIKYSSHIFSIDKMYAKNLANKVSIFQENTRTKKQIFLAMVITSGLKKNIWSEDLVNEVVELKDLF